MQIPILQGREFLPSDREGFPQVAILNQTMARRLFGTVNPSGMSSASTYKTPSRSWAWPKTANIGR